jgi:predicted transposase YdaD
LLSPPPQRDDLPAVVLEEQMAADSEFLLRLHAESGRFLQQERWQRDWRVVVICPSRELNFGALIPVREFVEHRVQWIELIPRDGLPPREPLTQVLSLLLQPESELSRTADALRQQAFSNPLAAEALPLIPAILNSRFNDQPVQEISAMGGITLEDFTKSRAYREIFSLGEAEGEARGEARGEAKLTLLLLQRRCGPLSESTTSRIQAIPPEQLEELAEALLDFHNSEDLATWLTTHAGRVVVCWRNLNVCIDHPAGPGADARNVRKGLHRKGSTHR